MTTNELEHENGMARLAFTVVHECLFERQPPATHDAIRALQGVLQRYGDREFGKQEKPSPRTSLLPLKRCLSPHVEIRLRWMLAWILMEFLEEKDITQAILRFAAEHLQKAVSFKTKWGSFDPFTF